MQINKNNTPKISKTRTPISNFECKADKTAIAIKKIPILKFQKIKPEKEIRLDRTNEELLNNLQTKVTSNYNVQDNLFKGTAQDLNECLKGTKLAGSGQAFLDAQKKYGVNALFLMSIVKAESNYGEAPAKDRKTGTVHKYNVAGLKKRSGGYQEHSSYAECINSCASSLKRLYFNKSPKALVTINQIHNQYCLGNKKWTKEICDEMNRLSSKILKQYK
jgi:hypothetical protein